MSSIRYIIIDVMSMVGRKEFGQIDNRLRQAFPHHAQEVFGGCSLLLFGDFGQLPPVMDLPLYTTDSRSDLSDQGRTAYLQFDKAFTLTQVMRQAGSDPDQVRFRDILLRLRNAQVTKEDWEELIKHMHPHNCARPHTNYQCSSSVPNSRSSSRAQCLQAQRLQPAYCHHQSGTHWNQCCQGLI